jgi:hypothetical protein
MSISTTFVVIENVGHPVSATSNLQKNVFKISKRGQTKSNLWKRIRSRDPSFSFSSLTLANGTAISIFLLNAIESDSMKRMKRLEHVKLESPVWDGPILQPMMPVQPMLPPLPELTVQPMMSLTSRPVLCTIRRLFDLSASFLHATSSTQSRCYKTFPCRSMIAISIYWNCFDRFYSIDPRSLETFFVSFVVVWKAFVDALSTFSAFNETDFLSSSSF